MILKRLFWRWKKVFFNSKTISSRVFRLKTPQNQLMMQLIWKFKMWIRVITLSAKNGVKSLKGWTIWKTMRLKRKTLLKSNSKLISWQKPLQAWKSKLKLLRCKSDSNLRGRGRTIRGQCYHSALISSQNLFLKVILRIWLQNWRRTLWCGWIQQPGKSTSLKILPNSNLKSFPNQPLEILKKWTLKWITKKSVQWVMIKPRLSGAVSAE